MNTYCETTLSVFVGILSVLYLAFQLHRKRWSAVLSFIVIIVVLCCLLGVAHFTSTTWCMCALLAIVGSNVVALPHTVNQASVESFANHDKHDTASTSSSAQRSSKATQQDTETTHKMSKDTHTKMKKAKTDAHTSSQDDAASDSDSEEDTMSPHKTATKKTKQKGTTRDKSNSKEKFENVDNFSTFMETYKSLSPDQIETMTSDTQDLISTQQALMETVKGMAPVIKQGKEMMDTFKDYFGPGNTSDLLKAFKQ